MTHYSSPNESRAPRLLLPTRRLWIAVAAACVAPLLAGTRAGSEQPAKTTETPKTRRATVIEISGKARSGILQTVDSEFVTIVQSGAVTKIAISDVLRVDFSANRKRQSMVADYVILVNGDRLRFTTAQLDSDDLIGRRNNVTMRIPLASVRGIMFRVADATDDRDEIETILNTHRDEHDLLVLRNGDRLSGLVKALDRTSVTMNKANTKSPLAGVRALAFNPRHFDFPKPIGRRILLGLADGSRVTANKLTQATDGRMKIAAAYGGTLHVAMASIVSLRVLGDRAASLSDLKPEKYEFTPFLGGRWMYQPDRNAKGGRLTLRGREYAKGIGMHSQSRLTFNLAGGGYRMFYAVVGIDDAARSKGSAHVAVEVDGQRVFEGPEITGTNKPLSLKPIDVTGKQRLTLIVEFGRFADVLDLVDWCDAVLVKK